MLIEIDERLTAFQAGGLGSKPNISKDGIVQVEYYHHKIKIR